MRCSPQSAENIFGWINRQLPEGTKPAIQRPVNYVRVITITTTLLGTISFFSVAYPYILPVIQNRNLWAGISLITILLFTSGHMYNHIRKVPYVAGDGKGGISYFAGGFSNQFGMETQIVAAMCKSSSVKPAEILTFKLTFHRRRQSCLRYHCSSLEGPSNVGSHQAASGRVHLGRHYAWHVQLPVERVQDQEWRLPVPSAAILSLPIRLFSISYYSIERLLGICIDSFSLKNFHCATCRPSIG